MTDNLISILFYAIALASGSVMYDFYSYEDRQTKWEKAHPGATYIRGYRKFEKQSKRAAKLRGEL